MKCLSCGTDMICKIEGHCLSWNCPNCGDGIMYWDGCWECTNCGHEIYSSEDDNDGIIG